MLTNQNSFYIGSVSSNKFSEVKKGIVTCDNKILSKSMVCKQLMFDTCSVYDTITRLNVSVI